MVAGLSAGPRCVKYLMFIFNLIFVITGILLISFGAVILGMYHSYDELLDNKFFSVPSFLIAVGAMIFFIAFFACCGAVRENYCMIVTFTALMVLIFILELSGGIAGYVLRSHSEDIVIDNMNASMFQYNKSHEITDIWDDMQRKFTCCGTTNYTNWQPVFGNDFIPASCCELEAGDNGNATCLMNSTKFHGVGCGGAFTDYVRRHAMQLGGVGIGVAFVQLLGIWFSIFLAKSIRNSYETV